MALVKVSKPGVWRELWEDPTLVATSKPQFPPGDVDFLLRQNEQLHQLSGPGQTANPLYLPSAVATTSITYTCTALPTGLTFYQYTSPRRAAIIGNPTVTINRHKATLTATTSGGTATKDFTISVFPALTPTTSVEPTNLHIESIRYFTGLQSQVASVRHAHPNVRFLKDVIIAWTDPTDTIVQSVDVWVEGAPTPAPPPPLFPPPGYVHPPPTRGRSYIQNPDDTILKSANVARGVQRYESTRNFGTLLTDPLRVGDRLYIAVSSRRWSSTVPNQQTQLYVIA